MTPVAGSAGTVGRTVACRMGCCLFGTATRASEWREAVARCCLLLSVLCHWRRCARWVTGDADDAPSAVEHDQFQSLALDNFGLVTSVPPDATSQRLTQDYGECGQTRQARTMAMGQSGRSNDCPQHGDSLPNGYCRGRSTSGDNALYELCHLLLAEYHVSVSESAIHDLQPKLSVVR